MTDMYVRLEHALLQYFTATHLGITFDVFDFPAVESSKKNKNQGGSCGLKYASCFLTGLGHCGFHLAYFS